MELQLPCLLYFSSLEAAGWTQVSPSHSFSWCLHEHLADKQHNYTKCFSPDRNSDDTLKNYSHSCSVTLRCCSYIMNPFTKTEYIIIYKVYNILKRKRKGNVGREEWWSIFFFIFSISEQLKGKRKHVFIPLPNLWHLLKEAVRTEMKSCSGVS